MQEQQNDYLECSAGWAVVWLACGALTLAVLETAQAGLVGEAAQTGLGDVAGGAGMDDKLV